MRAQKSSPHCGRGEWASLAGPHFNADCQEVLMTWLTSSPPTPTPAQPATNITLGRLDGSPGPALFAHPGLTNPSRTSTGCPTALVDC